MSDSLIDLQGLYTAYCQCRRHKRRTVNAQHYEVALLDNLFNTLEALQNRSYTPSRSMRFIAQKPKVREIHAAHFSDRVVHHWLVPRLEVLYEPIFIHDVYSNRVNKGTHKACDRLQAFMHAVGHQGPPVPLVAARSQAPAWECSTGSSSFPSREAGASPTTFPSWSLGTSETSEQAKAGAWERANQGWYLQLDIRNFFNSIDRPILFQLLQHRLRKALGQGKLTAEEADTLRWLAHVLLRHDAAAHSVYRGNPDQLRHVPPHKQLGSAGEHKGLPIGNLTSQFFANVYLNELDQFVKHQLKCAHYLRYVDDFILLATTPELLVQWRGQIENFLQQRLQLQLKERAEPKPVKSGSDFLGYIIYPHYRLVRRRVVGNLRERLNAFQSLYIRGSLKWGYHIVLKTEALRQLRATLTSYWGHFQHANSLRLCAALFRHYPWLNLLFDDSLQPRWQPSAQSIVGYKSQLRFFRKQYPLAELRVQRGTEQDKIFCANVGVFLVDTQDLCGTKGQPQGLAPTNEYAGYAGGAGSQAPAWEPGLGSLSGALSKGSSFPTYSKLELAAPEFPTWRLGTSALGTSAKILSCVNSVIIREQGHLKNGLKCRVATLLFIQPGVPLCPYAKK